MYNENNDVAPKGSEILQKYRFTKHIDIESLSSFHYFEFDDSFVDHFESHEPWELVYIDRGECYIVTDKERFLLSQGEMYFHKPYERHKLEMSRGSYPNVLIITFSTASRGMCYFEGRKLQASLSTKQHIAAILHEATNTFEQPFHVPYRADLKLKRENALWGGEQSILLRLELMLIELVRKNHYYAESPRRFYGKELVSDEFCLRVIAFMERYVYEKFSMDDLCHEMSFSKSYISRRFAGVCGVSVMEYFNMVKIGEAKRLIRETSKNFQEISDSLAFSSAHYFSTIFKKYAGMTPTQYKKSCKTD